MITEVATDAPVAPGMTRVLVPVAQTNRSGGEPAFMVDGPLQGLKVGLRHEGSWRSWMLIVSVWEDLLRADGAIPVVLHTGERVGDEGVKTRAMVEAWAAEVDCAVSGLGTCGSCTSWSVADAVSAEAETKPAVVAVCSEFEAHARNMATHLNHPDLKVLVLPYPLEARPEAELREIALEWYPKFLSLIGATV